MRFAVLSLLVLSVFYAYVASEPRPVKGDQGGSYINQDSREAVPAEYSDDYLLDEFRQADLQNDDIEDYKDSSSNTQNTVVKPSDSSARLFFRRFMRLKNLFGNNNQPIIIRVFLNGTSAVTNIPTIPTNPTAPTGTNIATIPTSPLRPRNDETEETEDDTTYSEKPTTDYQKKEAKKSQDIIVRIPAKYRHLFSNGQQVKLSTNSGDKKRRLANRRNNVNTKKHNSNIIMRNKNKLARIISI